MKIALFVQWMVVVTIFLAMLFQLAVHRTPDIVDAPGVASSRRVTFVAMLIAVLYLGYLSMAGQVLDKPITLTLGLIAVGQLGFNIGPLFSGGKNAEQ